jgi:hypothetical protein
MESLRDVHPKYTPKGIHIEELSIPSSRPNTVRLSTLLLRRDHAASPPEHVVLYCQGIYSSSAKPRRKDFLSFRYHIHRQRGKPAPSHPRLCHAVECRPIAGHPCACPTILLDILSIPSHPDRSHNRLHRRARLCRFPLPDVAPDDLWPLPRRVHRAVLAGVPRGRTERSTHRRRARSRTRKCVYERARHGPHSLPAALAAVPLPRPIRVRPVGRGCRSSWAHVPAQPCASRDGARERAGRDCPTGDGPGDLWCAAAAGIRRYG